MKTLHKSSDTHYFIGEIATGSWQVLAQSENIADLTEQLQMSAAHLPSGEKYNVISDAVCNEETGEIISEAVTELVTEIYEGTVENDKSGGWFCTVENEKAFIAYYSAQIAVSLSTKPQTQNFKGSLRLICKKLNEIFA